MEEKKVETFWKGVTAVCAATGIALLVRLGLQELKKLNSDDKKNKS